LKMKKFALALTAVAAFTGSAMAADLAPRPYTKAPPPVVVPVANWTGCYISGGAGYGIFKIDHDERDAITGIPRRLNSTSGGDGYLVGGGVGCDYQFNNRWVVGAFVDGAWSNLKGDYMTRVDGLGDAAIGQLKQNWTWAAGARVGYLVTPSFLTYLDAGFTEAHFNAVNLYSTITGVPTGAQLAAQSFNGVFVGSGFEYSFDFLPGLFVKTEGRANIYSRKDVQPTCVTVTAPNCPALGTLIGAPGVNGAPFQDMDSRRPVTYTAMTSLVYRFNWGGPVVAKY
jgi:outer membrane immunogenic protein